MTASDFSHPFLPGQSWPHPSPRGHVRHLWAWRTDTNNQLQSSTDLTAASWLDVGAPFVGTDSVRSANFTAGPDPKKFFRLHLRDH